MVRIYIKALGLIGVCSLVAFLGIALATDPPHWDPEGVNCNYTCHTLHNAQGSNLTGYADNANLCLSCHVSSGQASNWPLSSADQATPGTSGTSHRWDGMMPATSNPGNAHGLRAAAYLTNTGLKNMLNQYGGVATCSVCHDPHTQAKSPFDPFAAGSWPGGDSGVTNAAGTQTTVVTGKSWTANQWTGFYVTMTGSGAPTSAANIGQSILIASNNANTLTLAGVGLPAATASGDTFTINGVAAGTATAGTTASAIVDNTKGWVANTWTNYYVQFISGANNGLARQVASNTNNTLTLTAAFPAAPAAGDSYYITNNITGKDFGTATSGNQTTITQTGKAWTTNQWAGYYVKMTSGLNNGLERRIASNNNNTLTLATGFPNAVGADTYYIKSNRHFMRVNNALNELCADCHYYRTPDSKPSGVSQTDVRSYDGNKKSHPLGKKLSDVADPTQFLTTGYEPSGVSQGGGRGEMNGGADTNYTNNVVMGLDNEIGCLSCHGVHFTDSNSATVDQP